MLPNKEFFEKYVRENNLPWNERNVLMEYLQTQVLKGLSMSNYRDKISFLGGTCLRFIYGIQRYSEDLDFDLIDHGKFSVHKLSEIIKKNLELWGYQIDARVKTTENIHIIFFKFGNVLQEFGFKVHKDEKFLVKFEIDFSPFKNIVTQPRFVDSFNEHFPIVANTPETIFAQKIIAVTFRPYQKGRDFYDLIWFLARKNIEPNYDLLAEKGIKIKDKNEAVAHIKKVLPRVNLKQAAKDVERFLFYPEQAEWILDLPKYLDGFAKQNRG